LRLPLFRWHCTNICIVAAIVACIVARIDVGFVSAIVCRYCCRCVYCCIFVRCQFKYFCRCGHFCLCDCHCRICHCRVRFMPIGAQHPLPNSTGPYLGYGGPSTSAILFYQSSWRHRHGLLLLPILTAAAYFATNVPYLCTILFFTFQPRQVFLRHSHL